MSPLTPPCRISCAEVEEEGGGRVRRHTHGPRTEQDRPRLTVRDRPVRQHYYNYFLYDFFVSLRFCSISQ